MDKNPPASAGDVRDMGSIAGSGRSLEEGMATHSSILGLPFNSITDSVDMNLSKLWGIVEYGSGLPFPSPGELLDPGIEPMSHVSCTGGQVLYHKGVPSQPEGKIGLPRANPRGRLRSPS